ESWFCNKVETEIRTRLNNITTPRQKYQKFLLDKQIYKKKNPLKKIQYHTNYQHYFYKYHTIQMSIGDKFFTEEELLAIQKSV
ncbi:MAG: hypothetical protein K2K50_04350, partial [Anaeroplasmataceae bacterium]|nr:hypothetical protein [Anaeroplasmataceae bacterium]